MAREPYSASPPVPAAIAQTEPAPPERIATSPSQFGGLLGAGEEQAGATLQQTGAALHQTALTLANFYNEAQAQSAQDQWADASNKILHDPKDGFYVKKGIDAQAGLEGAQTALSASRAQAAAGLANDRQRLMFDMLTRRTYDYHLFSMSQHADNETMRYATGQWGASIENRLQQAGVNWNNDQLFSDNLEQAQNAAQALGKYSGWSQEQIDAKRNEITSRAWQNRIVQASVTDPTGAKALFDANANKLEPAAAASIQQHLQSKLDAADVSGVVAAATGQAPTTNGFNNNVGNLKASGANWEGKGAPFTTASGAKFETFVTPEAGVAAATKNIIGITAKNGGNLSLSQLISIWAPKEDNNDPAKYAATVAGWAGMNPSDPVPVNDPAKMAQLVKAMTRYEKGGIPFNDSVFTQGVQSAMGGQHTGGFTDSPNVMPQLPSRAEALQRVMDATEGMPTKRARAIAQVEATYAAADKAQKERDDYIYDGITSQLILDPTKVTAEQIAGLPLTGEKKWQLFRMAQEATADSGNKDVKTYGTSYWSLFNRIHAGQDDPNRITDADALLPFAGPGGGLSVSGFDKLRQEIQGRKTADGEAWAETQKQFFSTAKQQISGKNDLLGIPDPKGEELFLKFLPQAYAAIDAGRKAGLSAAQLFSPDSKDYIGKIIPSFKRTLAEQTADMRAASLGGLPVAQTKGGAPDLSSEASAVAAYRRGEIDRRGLADALTKLKTPFRDDIWPSGTAFPP